MAHLKFSANENVSLNGLQMMFNARLRYKNINFIEVCTRLTHLSTVATSEQNEDSSRGDGGAQFPLVLAERLLPMALQFTGNILSGVVAGLRKVKNKHFKSAITFT